jgi:hypothetical protein
MAFEPEHIDFSQINGGKEYDDSDIVSEEDINKLFKSASFVQKFVDVLGETIDTSEINGEGTPEASFVSVDVGGQFYKKLKLKNLKGRTGDSGIGDALLSNYNEDSDKDGLTQRAINRIVEHENFVINPVFSVNQRGIKEFSSPNVSNSLYVCDRWAFETPNEGAFYTQNENNSVTLTNNTSVPRVYFRQYIPKERVDFLKGKNVTISAVINGEKVSSTGLVPTENVTTVFARVTGNGYNFAIRLTSNGTADMYVQVLSGYSVEISSVKLELGTVATEIVTPLYNEELLKCQYFYQKLNVDLVAFITNESIVSIPLNCSMRDSKTIGEAGRLYGANYEEDVALSLYSSSSNSIQVSIVPNTPFVANSFYALKIENFEIDGEI